MRRVDVSAMENARRIFTWKRVRSILDIKGIEGVDHLTHPPLGNVRILKACVIEG